LAVTVERAALVLVVPFVKVVLVAMEEIALALIVPFVELAMAGGLVLVIPSVEAVVVDELSLRRAEEVDVSRVVEAAGEAVTGMGVEVLDSKLGIVIVSPYSLQSWTAA
jgi:hypothetical protein